MFPNLQLRTQLLVFAGILCALLLAVGLTGLMGTRLTHGHFVDTQADVSLADKVAAINYKVFDSRLHIALAQNGADGEQMRKEGATVAANIEALNVLLKELAALPAPPQERGAVDQFGQVVQDFTRAYLVPAVQAMEAGKADELRSLVAAQADRFYQPIKQGRERIQEAQKTTVQAHREDAAASYRLTLAAVLLLSGLGVLISAVFAWQSVRAITRKTNHLRDTLQHIATRHDLTAKAALVGKDELAEIASHLNILLASIGTVLASAGRHSQDAEAAGDRLLRQADEAQQAIEQQDRALAAGSSALGQVADQTQRIAESMREAAQLADDGAARGSYGAELVNRVADTMGEIATKVGEAGAKIEQLGEQSAKVDGIAITIQEIAGQTNLLALNAAIEAARAGETGRGFAVVADEVRKLAERTQQATSEIQRTLQAIRAETVTATESMKHGREEIDAGIVQAQEAAAAINGIRELVATVNQRIKEIDAAIQHQALASESVSTRMQESASLSRRSADLSQSTRDTAHEVGDIGQKLRDAVATFRV